MSLRKISATLLAGTVTLAGTVMMTAAPAAALTPVSELKDVSPDHWAYNAIQTLVEKYQVMEGFPDRTFRGNKTLTRYELAASLAKVMAKVEQRIAQATGQSVEVEPGVNPEDLRTIARLQREFREELDQLKARVDTIDSRLMALEKRVRVSGKMQADYRDFTSVPSSAALTAGLGANGGVSADFRVRNSLNFDAQLMEDLAFMGQLNVDVYSPQSIANPYLRGVTAGPLTDVYVPKAVLGYNPGWISYAAGIGALRDHMAIGSTLQDPFKANVWGNATGGYGFVGTPGLSGANTMGTAPTATGAVGAPVWLTGTNVLVDLVDPNNSQAYEPTGNLISAAQANLGPLKVGFGVQRGALTGPYVQAGSITNPGAGVTAGLPATVPGLQTWQQGSFGVITAGLDFGLARLQVLANSPVTTLGDAQLSDKVLGASLDLGSDALGLTAEVASTSNFQFSGLTATKGSLRLGSGNLFDSGFGVALGLVAGDNGFGGQGANNVSAGFNGNGQFPVGASNLFAGQADYHSWGLMVKTPAFFILPSLTLAAQNSGSGLTPAGLGGSTAFGSGATIQTDFQIFGLPTLTAEYSLGKFGAGADQTIWGSSPWTHEQLALRTQVKF